MPDKKLHKPGLDGPPPKILIVDDRPENLLVLEVLLAPLGAEVVRANSGNEAIALTLEHDFALMLLDVQMPDMDGFEVAELLHDNEKTVHMPIIFISAIYSGDYYKIKGVESGAVDFIEKPIVPEILLGKVKIFLELNRHRRDALRESFRSIVENVSDGIMMIDRDGIVQMLNPAAEKILSIDAEDILYESFDYPVPDGKFREIIILKDNEKPTYAELNVATMKWQDEEVSIVSLRDVSERNQARESLQKSLKERDEKNLELQSFTYTVSHDLRSPLITISGYVGLLEQVLGDTLAEDARIFIDEIIHATKKMGNLLDHLLALSRIGRTEDPFAAISLTDLIEEVVETMRLRADTAGVEIQVQKGLPVVQGDYLRMNQVVQNLVENAIKYMANQNAPLIEIGFAESPKGKALFVKDNGPGILPKHHEKIFDLFTRLQNDDDGSGVGLALVKKIVELHDGEIWVESEGKGSGTTFWIKLPFRPENTVALS